MGDEGSGVQLPGGDQVQGLGTVAAIHPAGLEGEILAVHVGQREQLRPVVKGHHRHHRIGPGALPGQTEGVLAARHLQYHIRPSMGAVGQDRLPEPLRLQCQHLRIVGTDESQALGVPLTDDDPPGVFQQDALESAQAGGAGAQDEHRVLR